MLVTREMDYALRILRALHREGQLSAAAVARQENMQKAITLKLLNRLLAAGIVESRRGVSGGYFLKRPCEELSIYDVFQSIGEPPFEPLPAGGVPVRKLPQGRLRRLPGAQPHSRVPGPGAPAHAAE
nr:Rrf2 family transcriptional regulator [uncultured Alistipes sp.]